MSILKQNCPVALCSDHAGYDTKEAVKAYLESEGIAYKDFGTYSTDSCDYPDFAHPCAEAVEKGECYPGIAVCGTKIFQGRNRIYRATIGGIDKPMPRSIRLAERVV